MTRWKLDLNERSETPPNWATQALAELPLDSLWRYQDRTELERRLAATFGLDPDQVLLTNGGDEAIQNLFAALPADLPVLLPKPIFGLYPEQASIWPVRAIELPAKPDYGIDVSALASAIQANPGALCILTRPNNPTGEVIERASLISLIQASAAAGGSVLLDEAYADFFDDPMVDLIPRHANLIILRTFSKAFGLAGLRLGFLLGAADALLPLRNRTLPFNITAPSLFVGMRALGADARKDVRAYAAAVVANRNRILANLRDWDIETTTSEANFIFVRLGKKRANFVRLVLANQGFTVRCFRRASLEGCLRISIPADSLALENALALALRPQLLCLDVDGTLMDTRQSFDAMVVELVKEATGHCPTSEEIDAVRARGGFNDDFALAAELARVHGNPTDYEVMATKGTALYFGDSKRPGLHELEKPLFGNRLLQKLQKRCRLALVTGRARAELAVARDLLANLGSAPAITIDDVVSGKPNPEGIRLAATRTQSQRVWMVGDNPDDITAARGAGALPIGVGPNAEALTKAGAAIVLDDINEIEALL